MLWEVKFMYLRLRQVPLGLHAPTAPLLGLITGPGLQMLLTFLFQYFANNQQNSQGETHD